MANSIGQMKNRIGDARGMHPNSRKNLKNGSWQKGQSGNPAGLSLKRVVSDILREPLETVDSRTAKAIELLALAIVRDAIKGSKEDRKEIWERLEGKVAQPLVGGGESEAPIRIIYERVRSSDLKEENVHPSSNRNKG